MTADFVIGASKIDSPCGVYIVISESKAVCFIADFAKVTTLGRTSKYYNKNL